jgi:serine/threonine protein phosphatase PrpC
MEDAHTAIISHAGTGASFFAVFDGHGGKNTHSYLLESCVTHLYIYIYRRRSGEILWYRTVQEGHELISV